MCFEPTKQIDKLTSDLNDLGNFSSKLRSDLFKSRTQENVGSTEAVTIPAYYSTGTILVQGTKHLTWLL